MYKNNLIDNLVLIADNLETMGLYKEASKVDMVISKVAAGEVWYVNVYRKLLKPVQVDGGIQNFETMIPIDSKVFNDKVKAAKFQADHDSEYENDDTVTVEISQNPPEQRFVAKDFYPKPNNFEESEL